ncbi:MAG: hypothetical protein LBM38_05220 [Clostridiales bacterium]|jgi:Fe2+ transport system protein B|nr:hypothetical protein [Clostridiales bacterium]
MEKDIVLIGEPGVGKRSLLKCIAPYGGFYFYKNIKFNVYTQELTHSADCYILVVNARDIYKKANIIRGTITRYRNIILCINFIDEIAEDTNISLNQMRHQFGVPIVGTNAKRGLGIVKLIKQIFMSTQPFSVPADIPSFYIANTLKEN